MLINSMLGLIGSFLWSVFKVEATKEARAVRYLETHFDTPVSVFTCPCLGSWILRQRS
ncbi:hypothetical protein PTI98_009965 [Pleurotus ostreatus]|nr:hypothetical protein PTI98_009965 [Pleurotus ostreatus]